jgi:hypothetical protein
MYTEICSDFSMWQEYLNAAAFLKPTTSCRTICLTRQSKIVDSEAILKADFS